MASAKIGVPLSEKRGCGAVATARSQWQIAERKEGTMNHKGKTKARALGIIHVVLEVGDLQAALEFYGAIFDFKLRGKSDHNAFIDLGDQFIQLSLDRKSVV